MKVLLKTTIEKEIELENLENYKQDPQVESFFDDPIGMYATRVDAIILETHDMLMKFIKTKADNRHKEIIEGFNPEEAVQQLCVDFELILQELASIVDLNNQLANRYEQVIMCLPDIDEVKVQFTPIYNTMSAMLLEKREMFIKLCQGYKDEIKKYNKDVVIKNERN